MGYSNPLHGLDSKGDPEKVVDWGANVGRTEEGEEPDRFDKAREDAITDDKEPFVEPPSFTPEQGNRALAVRFAADLLIEANKPSGPLGSRRAVTSEDVLTIANYVVDGPEARWETASEQGEAPLVAKVERRHAAFAPGLNALFEMVAAEIKPEPVAIENLKVGDEVTPHGDSVEAGPKWDVETGKWTAQVRCPKKNETFPLEAESGIEVPVFNRKS